MAQLTANRLQGILHYNPETGTFTKISKGLQVGFIDRSTGYVRVAVEGVLYRAHRLAWLYVNGDMPKESIDHINGNRSDNRLCNLREATNAENAQNRKVHANNRSGFMGVGLHKTSGLWRSAISSNGFKKELGYFKNPGIAHEAYVKAKAELHTFSPFIRTVEAA